jgi:two-component system, NtrC family, response regulator GlrR
MNADTAPRVLIVDDEPDLRQLLGIRLKAEGYEVDSAPDGKEAMRVMARRSPRLVISDLRMPGMEGLELLTEIQRLQPNLPVILLTAHGTIAEAVTAMQRGAFDFLTKPVDKEALVSLVRRALELNGSVPRTPAEASWREEIITANPRMQQLLDEARQVAGSDTSVLITGESGTGKELLARAIHRASPRRDKPFVAINCGAMPENLLESELFGHRKGAFTGATAEHPGLFRAADGGTLLLDEIGDMPLPLQVKLMRVLQERQVRPVGGTRSFPVDVRILSATHRDLKAALEDGRFRGDLYYRLNVVALHLPSLDQRRDDIPALVAAHLRRIAERRGVQAKVYAPEAMELLVAASWPGNVRQLLNVVEQNVAMTSTAVIGIHIVRRALGDEAAPLPSLNQARDQFTRGYLMQLLQITRGNVSEAARLAARNRSEFYTLLARHGLEPARFKVRPVG